MNRFGHRIQASLPIPGFSPQDSVLKVLMISERVEQDSIVDIDEDCRELLTPSIQELQLTWQEDHPAADLWRPV